MIKYIFVKIIRNGKKLVYEGFKSSTLIVDMSYW